MWGSLSLASATRPWGRGARYGWAGLAGTAGGPWSWGPCQQRDVQQSMDFTQGGAKGPHGSQTLDQEVVTVPCAGKRGLNSDLSEPTDEGADVHAAEEMKSVTTGDGMLGGKEEGRRRMAWGLRGTLPQPHVLFGDR